MIASLLALAPLACPQDWSPPPPPPVVPSPAMSQPRYAPFVVPEALRVVTSEVELEPLAPVLASHLSRLLGRDVPVGAPPSRAGDVILTLGYIADPVAASPEALSVEVFVDHVALSGSTPDGVARAAARMLQLLEQDDESGAWSLPPVRIDDAPAYPFRALVLEPGAGAIGVGRAIDCAFLGSMNAVIVRGASLPRPAEGETDVALALRGKALARGIQLVLEGQDDPPYARAADDTAAPVLIADDAELDLAALAAAGRAWIDGRSPALRIAHGDEREAAALARAYEWRPTSLAQGVGEDARATAAELAVGSAITIDVGWKAGTPALPPTFPHLVERAWGGPNGPATLEEFAPRADAFLLRTQALMSSR